MKHFSKDLQDVVKTLKSATAKIEKLQKQFSEMAKKHPKIPAKKAAAKKTVARKVAPKRAGATASDKVLAIVNRSKKGVDSADVMKKTGFDKKKVANIFARMKKQGKIKNSAKGIYLKA